MGKYRDLEAVKAYIDENENRLKNCRHHDFQRPNNESLYHFTYICRNCGGRVDFMAKTYYEIGYQHGRQVLNEIQTRTLDLPPASDIK